MTALPAPPPSTSPVHGCHWRCHSWGRPHCHSQGHAPQPHWAPLPHWLPRGDCPAGCRRPLAGAAPRWAAAAPGPALQQPPAPGSPHTAASAPPPAPGSGGPHMSTAAGGGSSSSSRARAGGGRGWQAGSNRIRARPGEPGVQGRNRSDAGIITTHAPATALAKRMDRPLLQGDMHRRHMHVPR
jgi:hypothetical protein